MERKVKIIIGLYIMMLYYVLRRGHVQSDHLTSSETPLRNKEDLRDSLTRRPSESNTTVTKTSGKEAMQLFVYNYVVNVTKIVTKQYLDRLRETINLHDFPSDLNLNLEQSYPCLIPKEIRIKYPATKYVKGTHFTMPFIFAETDGRLGNSMGVYATQFALSKLYNNISTGLSPIMSEKLIKIFPHLSIKQMPLDMKTDSLGCMDVTYEPNDLYNYAASEIGSAGLFGLNCFKIRDYPFEIRNFNGVREQIVREFTFSDTIQQKVRDFFSSIQESVSQMTEFQDSAPTFIGIHARRTDYMKHLKRFGSAVPDDTYFIRAIQYYREKFTLPIFIASSDDMTYIKDVLKNEKGVFYSNGGTPDADMAILSSCNHSIFSLGSYGFWGAYLAGGEAVYADMPSTKPYRFSKYYYEEARLSNFIPLPGHLT